LTNTTYDISEEQNNNVAKADIYFKEIKPGLRLIYLLPLDTTKLEKIPVFDSASVGDLSGLFNSTDPYFDNFSGGTSYFNQAYGELEQNTGLRVAMGKVRDREKAYSVFEKISTGDGDPNSNNTDTQEQRREIYPIPLVDTSTCIDGESKWWSERKNLPVGVAEPDSYIWNAELERTLKQEMINLEEFKLMFDYIFPVDRYFSLMNAYSIISVSSIAGIEEIFDGTKSALYYAFMSLCRSSGYKHQTPTNDLIISCLDNLKMDSAVKAPCFSFKFGGAIQLPCLKGIGFDVIKKMIIKFPLIVFKALVEQFDPNIKLSKFILEILLSLGICLPIPFISLALLPPTVFGFPPFGIGIGPPLTPFGFGYLALGFNFSFFDINNGSPSSKSLLSTDSPPAYCAGKKFDCDD
jgi:hypothetical protein